MRHVLIGVFWAFGALAAAPLAAADGVEGEGVIERPFVEGGAVRLNLSSGDYVVRAGASDRIVVGWDADRQARLRDLRRVKVDVFVADGVAAVLTEGPANRLHVVIEVPARSDVRLRMRAGDVAITGIEGHTDVRMTAGDLTIGVRPGSLSRAHASVTFGDLDAPALGISKSGIRRSLDWTGAGAYALDVRLGAGDLRIRPQR